VEIEGIWAYENEGEIERQIGKEEKEGYRKIILQNGLIILQKLKEK